MFGSNEEGKHGGGAAKTALRWGAKEGEGIGLHGKTYAIPTRKFDSNGTLVTLSRADVGKHVNNFITCARARTDLKFLVTEIGCGLAGLQIGDVAPLFAHAKTPDNVVLPLSFQLRKGQALDLP